MPDLTAYKFTRVTGSTIGPCVICSTPHNEDVFVRIDELGINVGRSCLERAYAALSDFTPKPATGPLLGVVETHPDGPEGTCDRCGAAADKYLVRSGGAYCNGCGTVGLSENEKVALAGKAALRDA
jgi:hypothetical protein